MTARSFSVMKVMTKNGNWLSVSEIAGVNASLEGAFLSECISGQRRTLRSFSHLNADSWRVRRSNPRRPQHGILREHLAVHLGHQIILAIRIAAPHLPELNGTHGH